MPKTLYILDSHSHLYASYFAIPNLAAPDGEPTGAVFGFVQAVLKILRDKQPDYLVAVYDGPEETFRKKAFADYKLTRKPMPDDLVPQIGRSKEILRALGVRVVEMPGYEADDLVALFTEQARRDGCQVVIVSRDKDLMQLLGPGVVLFDNRKDLTLDAAWLMAEKGLRPEQVPDWLGLMGDTSDNIPGVPGIGEKRAVALLQQYGSMDEILAHAGEIKGKMGESLREHADQARMSRDLATLKSDLPTDLVYTDLAVAEADRPQVAALMQRLAFKKLAEQFETPAEAPRHEQRFECVADEAALKRLAATLAKAEAFAFDTELTGLDPLRDRLVGLSFSTGQGIGWYVPVMAPEGEAALDLDTVRAVLGPVLRSQESLKVAHNAKFDLAVLGTAGLTVEGPLFDTMIASYLLDPGSRSHGLDALAAEHLGYRAMPITDLIGEKKRGSEQKTMDQAPLAQITFYAAEDAEMTWRLYEHLAARFAEETDLRRLFDQVEMPLVRVLEKMERRGVALDLKLLAELSETFGRRMDALRDEIHGLAGREFNVDSPKQLGEVLFDELGLKPVKKTKTGVSTDSFTLESLASEHPLPAKVLQYRTLAKLKGTYVDALPQLIHPTTGRIHASFNQAAVATGRLSSSDPNLQNIPVRSDEGRRIRAAFVPGDPARDVLLSADYSQVELRLLAHFSQDPFLLDAFARDLDIHAFVASEVFGVPQDQVTGEQRSRAKAVNFGLIYGKTAYGLSRDLGIPVGEAQAFIDAYFARYTRVREFMDAVLERAMAEGYVVTILGRRRPTPGVKFTDAKRWTNNERAAFNTVLQGSAADLIKVAMVAIDRRIDDEGRPSRMILQVHDELVFEVPRAAVDEEQAMIVEEMTSALKLNVPMKVDVATGPNWREAK
ncbi:MAG TPA: DNA polymerase I [Phycisphaerae bacterium]|nr:DNA polymerase I [Phycisphaerae bacterium]